MSDRLDYELRAIEADNLAETAHRVSIAHSWRDIAQGYRMLADFIADAQAAQQRGDDGRFAPGPPRDVPASEESTHAHPHHHLRAPLQAPAPEAAGGRDQTETAKASAIVTTTSRKQLKLRRAERALDDGREVDPRGGEGRADRPGFRDPVGPRHLAVRAP
jgi:hypothetical protein